MIEKFREEMQAFIDGVYEGEKKILVFGEGAINARVMLIGEAPGEQETLKRRPFVGKAGKNLNEFMSAVGLAREEMYVSNAVKFRPTKISAAGNTVNRPPTTEEIALFKPWLEREIEIIQPRIIVTLGNVPLKALMGAKLTVGDAHGEPRSWRGTTLFPMYHPASVIYNRSLTDVMARDMEKLSQIV